LQGETFMLLQVLLLTLQPFITTSLLKRSKHAGLPEKLFRSIAVQKCRNTALIF